MFLAQNPTANIRHNQLAAAPPLAAPPAGFRARGTVANFVYKGVNYKVDNTGKIYRNDQFHAVMMVPRDVAQKAAGLHGLAGADEHIVFEPRQGFEGLGFSFRTIFRAIALPIQAIIAPKAALRNIRTTFNEVWQNKITRYAAIGTAAWFAGPYVWSLAKSAWAAIPAGTFTGATAKTVGGAVIQAAVNRPGVPPDVAQQDPQATEALQAYAALQAGLQSPTQAVTPAQVTPTIGANGMQVPDVTHMPRPVDWLPWVIGGGFVLAGVLILRK